METPRDPKKQPETDKGIELENLKFRPRGPGSRDAELTNYHVVRSPHVVPIGFPWLLGKWMHFHG